VADHPHCESPAMITDQELFATPKSKPAKHIASLRERRLTLQRRLREALIARDTAQREHNRLEQHVNAAEARGLALDQAANTKTDRGQLAKLTAEIEDHDRTQTAVSAAIDAIYDEIRQFARESYAGLVAEAKANHHQAREEIAQALQAIAEARARARSAIAAAQALTANAGGLGTRVQLRTVPSVEQIISAGGLDPLTCSVVDD
jgi:chromosome segregation ATPase